MEVAPIRFLAAVWPVRSEVLLVGTPPEEASVAVSLQEIHKMA